MVIEIVAEVELGLVVATVVEVLVAVAVQMSDMAGLAEIVVQDAEASRI